jgi:hypothetical protein
VIIFYPDLPHKSRQWMTFQTSPHSPTPLYSQTIKMVAPSLNLDTLLVDSPLPATQALEHSKRRLLIARESQRASLMGNKLANEIFDLRFDDATDPFPSIQWDSGDESDSDSIPSTGSWSSFLSKSDSTSSLGKRSLNSNARRLVRSKKIKSNLSSLGLGLSA